MAGLYIHIPFCKSRCVYCGFYSTTWDFYMSKYVESLRYEMEQRRDYFATCDDRHIKTIYLGGGTPSTLSREALRKILDAVRDVYGVSLADCEEATIECNPDDVDDGFATFVAGLGFNRVSMGVQTFDDSRLRFLHRRHTADDAVRAVDSLRKAGISNVSLDLMFGFPGSKDIAQQTVEQLEADCRRVIDLGVDHVSSYSLMYEEETPLMRMLEDGVLEEVDDGLMSDMYYAMADVLTGAGYEHYEISNFAKPGKQSLHNSSYWNQTPYIGIGASAHSYNGNGRQWNVDNIEWYMEYYSEDGYCSPAFFEEKATPRIKYNDMITTALRTREGIRVSGVGKRYQSYMLHEAEKYITTGLLERAGDMLRLTRKGLMLSDMVMRDLIN